MVRKWSRTGRSASAVECSSTKSATICHAEPDRRNACPATSTHGQRQPASGFWVMENQNFIDSNFKDM